MPNSNHQIDIAQRSVSRWSNRILLAALAGILFLTLYPFRVNVHRALAQNARPFLLGTAHKKLGALDVFLNVLLFVPFGFGLAEKLREKGKPRFATFLWAVALGAICSYGIEFSQLFIPPRDSGWTDVFTNSTGSVVGFLLFELAGSPVLAFLSKCENALTAWITLRRVALALAIYFAIVFWMSAMMQKEARLSDWDPSASLWLGANGKVRRGWSSNLILLQLWDRAVPNEIARKLTSGQTTEAPDRNLVANYDLSGLPPFRDRQGLLPSLSPQIRAPVQSKRGLVLSGMSRLVSDGPITRFVRDVQRANQFAVRVICSPSNENQATGDILSISRSGSSTDLLMRHEDAELVFWFRTPLSVKPSIPAWHIPNVFEDNRSRDILFSYNGSDLVLTIDGKQFPEKYELTPGTALARVIKRIEPNELEGYALIFDALVFLPAAFLLGLAIRRSMLVRAGTSLFLAVTFLVPPTLFEVILSRTSGRAISLENIFLAVALSVSGFLWINADGFQNRRAGIAADSASR
jgi:hypothetical protein